MHRDRHAEGALRDQVEIDRVLHEERLRAQGLYDRMRETIRSRDTSWTGSVNPMLAGHGERSEAPQYSGRAVSDDWTCPFRRRPTQRMWEADEIAADLSRGAFRAPSPAASEQA